MQVCPSDTTEFKNITWVMDIMKTRVDHVVDVLSISPHVAEAVLRGPYKWNHERFVRCVMHSRINCPCRFFTIVAVFWGCCTGIGPLRAATSEKK